MTDEIALGENSTARLAAAWCPGCYAKGTLKIISRLQAKPIGEFSLAGNQMKVSAREVPVLVCRACEHEVVGRFEDDGHVVFDPQPVERDPDGTT